MKKVSCAGEEHYEAEAVGSFDNFPVFHRSAGLNNRYGTCFRSVLYAIREREVGIAGHHATGGVVARRPTREVNADSPVWLTGTHSLEHRILSKHDRIRVNQLARLPREGHVGQLLFGWRFLRNDLPVGRYFSDIVGLLNECAACHVADIEKRGV